MKSVFEYKKYQSLLLDYCSLKRGNQARLCEFLGCRPSFITQVIDEKVNLSVDQGSILPDFFGFNKLEKLAFILLLQKDKVSQQKSKEFYLEQIQKLKAQSKSIKERIEIEEELSEEAKATYYSSWIYGAIHILCAFKFIKTAEDLTELLNLDRESVLEAINFLQTQGLIETQNHSLIIGKKQIHLSKSSKNIFNHHINWRLKTIERLNGRNSSGTHFSSLIGISKKDEGVVAEILLKAISDINDVVKKSGEDAAYVVNLDFFPLTKETSI